MLLHTDQKLFVLGKLNAKWSGMIKSLVARVESAQNGGIKIYQVMQFSKRVVLSTQTHFHTDTSGP